MKVTIHENKADYTPTEVALLAQAYQSLEIKAQAGELTLDETRIRIAYIRYQREDNFKIAIEPVKKAKKVTEPKVPKEKVARKPRTKKVVVEQPLERATRLLHARKNGEELSEEDNLFLDDMLKPVPDL
jgi:hypothetical protein